MRKILVLGAGIYQVPLIEAAKKLGLFTIVVSIKGNYPGFQIADKVYYEDTTNYKKILEIAKNECISAIVTTGTDVAMISVGYVCDHMGLIGVSYNSAICATDKANMKECFLKNNVNTADYFKVHNEEELLGAYDKLLKPVILKVVDKSGSRGIIKVEAKEELLKAYYDVLSSTNKDYILIEEFIDGVEFGIDAFVLNKKLEFVLPHEKMVYHNGETAVPLGHLFPFRLNEEQEAKIQIQMNRICSALQLDNCAINVDAFLYNDDVYIIEAGARAGATGIPELISGYTGRNYYEIMIQAALGEDITYLNEENGYWLSQIIISKHSGKIKEILLPDIKKGIIKLDYSIGDHVTKFKNGPDRIGQVILYDDTREAVVENMDHIIEQIEICVE